MEQVGEAGWSSENIHYYSFCANFLWVSAHTWIVDAAYTL